MSHSTNEVCTQVWSFIRRHDVLHPDMKFVPRKKFVPRYTVLYEVGYEVLYPGTEFCTLVRSFVPRHEVSPRYEVYTLIFDNFSKQSTTWRIVRPYFTYFYIIQLSSIILNWMLSFQNYLVSMLRSQFSAIFANFRPNYWSFFSKNNDTIFAKKL
jgi:hypothetical protein